MLRELHLTNFALLHEARVSFEPGLNVLSGETGAGKSLLVGALNLLQGARADSQFIRQDADSAVVEGLFEIESPQLRKDIAQWIDASDMDTEVLIRRTVTRQGRSKVSLNGRMITVTALKSITTRLIEIQGQREHHSLLSASTQIHILDSFGGLQQKSTAFADGLKELRELHREQVERRERTTVLRERHDFLQFQYQELSEAGLRSGELQELDRQFAISDNRDKIRLALEEGVYRLADDQAAVLPVLEQLKSDLGAYADLGDSYKQILEDLEHARELLRVVSDEMRHAVEPLLSDEQSRDDLEARINLLKTLESKYRTDEEGLIQKQEELGNDLNVLEFDQDEEDRISAEIKNKTKNLIKIGDTLHKARLRAAASLSRIVEEELGDLALKDMKFEISVSKRAADKKNPTIWIESCKETGYSDVEFQIRPNVGMELQPLSKIASGGELSRILMALQAAIAETVSLPVLVFDEIDANVGARLGQVVAEKLQKMSRGRQVICVTHLPQIASAAAQHLRVDKKIQDGQTHTSVESMQGRHREEEIASMIHGDRKTDITLRQARQMLKDAQKLT